MWAVNTQEGAGNASPQERGKSEAEAGKEAGNAWTNRMTYTEHEHEHAVLGTVT